MSDGFAGPPEHRTELNGSVRLADYELELAKSGLVALTCLCRMAKSGRPVRHLRRRSSELL